MVHEIPGIERIRLGSLEPRIITREFVDSIRKLPKVCPHFHLSLQSGCNATLERMNRKYTTAEYERSCELLREAYGHPAITTDVIVGFPGETEEEFDTTRAFLERIGFYEMHIFQYSRRRGTRAEKMPNQIPEPVKKERSGELLALAKRQSRQFREYYVGRETAVLLEEPIEIDGITYMTGFTPEYVRLAVPLGTQDPAALANRIVTGRVGAALSDEVYLLQREG
jgi:threonylcarbamoyladenosine tRNA methylthiotransferase MtaB